MTFWSGGKRAGRYELAWSSGTTSFAYRSNEGEGPYEISSFSEWNGPGDAEAIARGLGNYLAAGIGNMMDLLQYRYENSLSDQERVVVQAIDRAASRLEGGSCVTGLFGTPGSYSSFEANHPAQVLRRSGYVGTMSPQWAVTSSIPETDDEGGFTNSAIRRVYLYGTGFFFDGRTGAGIPIWLDQRVPWARGLDLGQVQELVVLHEFLHLTQFVGADRNRTVRLPDGREVSGSMGVSQEVRNQCFR